MRNEGTADRVIRFILGVGLLAVAWFMLDLGTGNVMGIVAAVVSVVLMGTAAIGFCPAYRLFGIRTCKLATPKD